MIITVNRPSSAKVRAFEVPIGQCYTWGTGQVHYLRVNTGSVCLSDWAFIPFMPSHKEHFDMLVRVGDGTVNLEYPA